MNNILKYFIREPEKEFHVRELAILANKSPTTISKYLNKMKRGGVLTSRRKFNHLLFRANSESQKFKDLKLFYNIKILRKSGLIGSLVKEFNNPEAIILFGSFAKAEDIASSDVDILVITPVKKEIKTDKFEKRLSRRIQLFLFSNKEIERMKEKNKELLNNLINGIVIHGFWEIFR